MGVWGVYFLRPIPDTEESGQRPKLIHKSPTSRGQPPWGSRVRAGPESEKAGLARDTLVAGHPSLEPEKENVEATQLIPARGPGG